MMGKRVPVTVPNVKVACYDDRVIQIDGILSEKMKDSLIVIRINIDYEVGIPVPMKY